MKKTAAKNYKGKTGMIIMILIMFVPALSFGAAETWRKVKWVNDGDTITLDDDTIVRLIGIDAPEIRHGEKPGQPLGSKAKKFVTDLIDGQKVYIELDRTIHDHYGRTLAYVFLQGGIMVNAEILKAGLARVLEIKPNNKYSGYFLSLQQKAMAEKKGLWSLVKFDTEFCYIGNKRTKKIHRPSCKFAKSISPENRKCFPEINDACRLGYAPCRNCQP